MCDIMLERSLCDTLVMQLLPRHVTDFPEFITASIMLTAVAQIYSRVEGAVNVKSGFGGGTWQARSRSGDFNLGKYFDNRSQSSILPRSQETSSPLIRFHLAIMITPLAVLITGWLPLCLSLVQCPVCTATCGMP